MTLLILGVALWWVAHLFKRLAPGPRAALGDAGKGLAGLVLLAALVLMVIGYRALPNMPNMVAMPGNGHANNTLMLIALIVFGAGMSKGWLWTKIRHPMLWGVVLWSVAHLLVRNDLPSLILFGGMGLWALVEMALINGAGPWQRPASGGIKRDGALAAIALVMYGLIAFVHIWLGYSPFLGNYG
ncbi:NnrU family protein [Acidimangrovimonas pyrenivorans]|uniref:NnrU family protein n=1 Tax=Acidimangrovimonas pyrenivorans TaxID=2030798 RepID=A0ABV7AHP7_9RHOB